MLYRRLKFAAVDDSKRPRQKPTKLVECPVVSADIPDWSRERKARLEWAPSRSLLGSIRDYQRFSNSKGMFAGWMVKVAVLRHRWWTMVTGADIPLNCKLG